MTVLSQPLYASIDLGSNSFHLLLARPGRKGLEVVHKYKQRVSLAAGLNAHNELSHVAIERGLACIQMFAEALAQYDNVQVTAVATATLRLAINAHDFLQPAMAILAHPIRVISGQEEAHHIYRGVIGHEVSPLNTLIIDIGGASTELAIGRGEDVMHVVSLDVGCLTLAKQCFVDGVINAANFQAAREHVNTLLADKVGVFRCFDIQACLGASGTPQAINDILKYLGINDTIKDDYLSMIAEQCLEYPHTDELKIPGLPENRRQIFPSGLAILQEIFRHLQIHNMQIAQGALREGLIYSMMGTSAK